MTRKYSCCDQLYPKLLSTKVCKMKIPEKQQFPPWFNFAWDSINFQFFKTSLGLDQNQLGTHGLKSGSNLLLFWNFFYWRKEPTFKIRLISSFEGEQRSVLQHQNMHTADICTYNLPHVYRWTNMFSNLK